MKKILSLIAISAIVSFGLIGCGSDSLGLDLYMTSSTGAAAINSNNLENLQFTMSSCNVTMTGFEVHSTTGGADSGWVSLTPPSGPIYLMQITNIENLLSNSGIAIGTYNQIRFTVSSATIVVAGTSYQADVPSSKIGITASFEIKDGDNTELVLNWNISQSVHQTGNNRYVLNPVITVKRIKNPSAN
jgi:hypothetical protein